MWLYWRWLCGRSRPESRRRGYSRWRCGCRASLPRVSWVCDQAGSRCRTTAATHSAACHLQSVTFVFVTPTCFEPIYPQLFPRTIFTIFCTLIRNRDVREWLSCTHSLPFSWLLSDFHSWPCEILDCIPIPIYSRKVIQIPSHSYSHWNKNSFKNSYSSVSK